MGTGHRLQVMGQRPWNRPLWYRHNTCGELEVYELAEQLQDCCKCSSKQV